MYIIDQAFTCAGFVYVWRDVRIHTKCTQGDWTGRWRYVYMNGGFIYKHQETKL